MTDEREQEQIPTCPICGREIGLPVWLARKHGAKYDAYCERCERAYTQNEIVWKERAEVVSK
jgi:hypothetical protein